MRYTTFNIQSESDVRETEFIIAQYLNAVFTDVANSMCVCVCVGGGGGGGLRSKR